jgi:hypothetical protein
MTEPQLEAAAIPVQGVVVRRSWQKHLLTFLMVFGPGLIVMEADNDAGAFATYGRTRSISNFEGFWRGCADANKMRTTRM